MYPHNSQCSIPFKFRRNNEIDTRLGGRGYKLLQFPQEEIERGVFDHIKKILLDSISLGDEHHGM